MSRYRVEFSQAAYVVLQETAAYIADIDGPDQAAHWLRKMEEGAAALETIPRGFIEVGTHDGRILHSKPIMSHRVYYFIDDAAELVTIIDVIHTRRETKLEKYRDDR